MKKLLLITFLFFTTLSFSQQRDVNNNTLKRNETTSTITSVTASPNPFNIRTVVRFDSKVNQVIEFSVKNLLGKTVYYIRIDAKKGLNSIRFERNDIAKGMYIYTLQSEYEVVSKRLVIQ